MQALVLYADCVHSLHGGHKLDAVLAVRLVEDLGILGASSRVGHLGSHVQGIGALEAKE